MKPTRIITLIVVALCPSFSWSQCVNDSWTDDPQLRESAEEHTAVYKRAVENNQFKEAAIAINWLAENAPTSNSDFYSHGAVIYDKLGERERDPVRKEKYLDSIMVLYDLKAKNCGDRAEALNAKVMYYYKYNVKSKPAETLARFDSLFLINKNQVTDAALIAYLETVKANQKKYRKLTDQQIIQCYEKAMKITDVKLKTALRNGSPTESVARLRDDLDALLLSMVVIDCKFLKNNLGPRFRQQPNDLALARKILSFMLQSQCMDDPLWLEAGERLYKNDEEKDFTLAKTLGLRHFSLGSFSKAATFFEDALKLPSNDRDKVDILFYLGRIRARKDKSAARKLFLQVLEIEKGNKEVYERIGDLYYNSDDECNKGTDPVENTLVFLLAAEYYQRSGNDQKVAMTRENFPTKAMLAGSAYVSGQEKFIGCWIQETTTIRTKD